jgi:hypothetical protein
MRLERWLALYLGDSPFQQVPPVEGDVWRLILRENNDISRDDAWKVFHAVQATVHKDHLVEEAFDYRDPD